MPKQQSDVHRTAGGAEALFPNLTLERQQSLMEILPTAVFTCDQDGLITYFNRRAAELWGRRPKLHDPSDRFCGSFRIYREDGSLLPHDQCPMALAVRQGRMARHEEIHILRPDGTTIIASVNIDPLLDDQGRRVGAINVFEDITRRKHAEERLQITNRLSEAVNQADAVEQIYELALDGLAQVLKVNRAAILLCDSTGTMRFQAWRGLSDHYRRQVDGHSPWSKDDPQPQPVLIESVAEADLGALRPVILAEGIRALAFIPLIDHGQLLGKFMIYYDRPHTFLDIEVEWARTIARHVAHALQRKQAEVWLQRYARMLESLNRLSLDLAAELDLEKQLRLVTEAAVALSGAETGAFFYNVTSIDGEAYMLHALAGVQSGSYEGWPMPRMTALFAPTFRDQAIIRLDDVTQDARFGQDAPHDDCPPPIARPLPIHSYLAVPVVARTGEVIGGLFLGHRQTAMFSENAEQLVAGLATQAAITIENARLYARVKDDEVSLRELNATLEQRVTERTEELARSNHELEQFAYIASHDLKAPLRAISLLASWIRDDAVDCLPVASQEHLARLRARAQRMERLLDDLLTYSRAGRHRHPLEQVDTAALVRNMAEMIAPPAGFVVHVAVLPALVTERTPLETVFRNLIGNAIKHHDHPLDGRVAISAHDRGDWVEFRVQDNGPGIDPAFHSRIFEMFQVLHSRDQVEGSGMGLALVKKHVESRGGSVWLYATPDGGATFCFTWPKLAR